MKRIHIIAFALLFCLLMTAGVNAAGTAPRLVDDADILDDAEENTLLAKLDGISERQMVDIVIHTVSSIGDTAVMEAADNIFESYGYGMDAERSCILLLVSMEHRDWHITTAGYGIKAVTDAGLAYMSEQFIPHLSGGDYLTAFTVYADTCDDFLNRARSGDPFDTDDLPKEPFPAVRNFLVCLVIGIIAAWIITGKQKAQLYTVRKQDGARTYTKENSMRVAESKDFFLYRTVSRTEKSDNSSGGSTTHKTDSGTTLGGGGGKF